MGHIMQSGHGGRASSLSELICFEIERDILLAQNKLLIYVTFCLKKRRKHKKRKINISKDKNKKTSKKKKQTRGPLRDAG
jgi:hypothetical protein